MRRRVVVLSTVTVLSCVAAVLAGVLVLTGSSASHPLSSAPQDQSARARQGREVATALRRLAIHPQAVVAAEARRRVSGHMQQALPTGSTVTPDEKSWAPDGIGGGTMFVSIRTPQGETTKYAAVMVYEHKSWRVLATLPVDGAR